jgi:predicted O-methyltransferase YrrM
MGRIRNLMGVAMKFRQIAARMMPSFLKGRGGFPHEMKALRAVRKLECAPGNLLSSKDVSLAGIFLSRDIDAMWMSSKKELDSFGIPDGTGGVNPGDRRALYYLISHFKPSSVLEIGTHIGASTIHIASALFYSRIKNGSPSTLTTVDVVDVNSPSARPWEKYDTNASPLEMVTRLSYGSFVKFVTNTSLHFASTCGKRFDFIFLDGDHRAETVYQEIPAALNLLTPDGVILLHDYFPGMRPLWSDGSVIPGPCLAVQRLAREGADLTVLPLGALPWPTKLGSNVTSLALLLRNA